MHEDLITTGDAARILGVSVTRVRQFLDCGAITPATTISTGWRLIRRADVDRLRRERDARRRLTRGDEAQR